MRLGESWEVLKKLNLALGMRFIQTTNNASKIGKLFCCQHVLRVVVVKMKILQNRTVSVISAIFLKQWVRTSLHFYERGASFKKGWNLCAIGLHTVKNLNGFITISFSNCKKWKPVEMKQTTEMYAVIQQSITVFALFQRLSQSHSLLEVEVTTEKLMIWYWALPGAHAGIF